MQQVNATSFRWTMDAAGDWLCVQTNKARQDVRKIGPYKDFDLNEDEAKTFRVAWERLGQGWPTEQVDFTPDGERVVIRAYYGSSTYNTKRMSRLIDMIVEDCKELGIETLTPQQLDAMKERWKCTR